MAKYTIELRDIVSRERLFDFSYPFYDETKRSEFERSFIRHFYFREIGTETVSMFKHYLEDKMLTIFPYYNELFQTATMEYSILDNYKLTETMSRKVEGLGKSAGVVSSRSESFDKQDTETDVSGQISREGTGEISDNGSGSETLRTTENTGETSKQNGTSKDVDKFLDTPQGKLNLDNTDYLTNIRQRETEHEENGERDVEHTSESERSSATNNKQTQTSRGTESNTGESKTTHTGEQRSGLDSNTRSERKDESREEYELIRSGNIGIDTDSDMIHKHIKLQQILKRIEAMFFDECEDLFMMIW